MLALANTVALYCGGAGSGCNPSKGKCGRKKTAGIPKHMLAPAREPIPPKVQKFIAKLLKQGYGVSITRTRDGKLFNASVTNTGRLEETWVN